MDFFPDPPESPMADEPEESPQPVWAGPPDDVLPGALPSGLVLARSDSTVVVLDRIRAFPTGVAMTLGVRLRGPVHGMDLNAEVFDGPYQHPTGSDWHATRLKWGWEFSDGRRATNVDPPTWAEHEHWRDPDWQPDRAVLSGQGGGGGRRSVERDYWLWPLPPAGRLRVVCQWRAQGIDSTTHDLDAGMFREAAARAQPVWTA